MTERRLDADADAELEALMTAFDPSDAAMARMERAALDALDRPKPLSLAAEWLEVLKLYPLSTPALALVCTAALLLLSPLSAIITAILGR
jgi:hypothetical protein